MELKLSENDFNALYVHDALVGLITYDNKTYILEFALKCYTLDNNKNPSKQPTRNILLKFTDVIYHDMTSYAPWKGDYEVFECKTISNSSLFIRMEEFKGNKSEYTHYQFLLDSGDYLNILAKGVCLKE